MSAFVFSTVSKLNAYTELLHTPEQLELEAESIIDFTTINPFGEVQVRP